MMKRFVLLTLVAAVLALTVQIVFAQDVINGQAQTTLYDRSTLFTVYGGTAVATICLGILNYLGVDSKSLRLIVVLIISTLISIGSSWFVNPDPNVVINIIITVANIVLMTGSTLGINEFGSRGGRAAAVGSRRFFRSLF